jgi:hypothetical protein
MARQGPTGARRSTAQARPRLRRRDKPMRQDPLPRMRNRERHDSGIVPEIRGWGRFRHRLLRATERGDDPVRESDDVRRRPARFPSKPAVHTRSMLPQTHGRPSSKHVPAKRGRPSIGTFRIAEVARGGWPCFGKKRGKLDRNFHLPRGGWKNFLCERTGPDPNAVETGNMRWQRWAVPLRHRGCRDSITPWPPCGAGGRGRCRPPARASLPR